MVNWVIRYPIYLINPTGVKKKLSVLKGGNLVMKRLLIIVTLGILCSLNGVGLGHSAQIIVDENWKIDKMPLIGSDEKVVVGYPQTLTKTIAEIEVISKQGVLISKERCGITSVKKEDKVVELDLYYLGRFEPGDEVKVSVRDKGGSILSSFPFEVGEKNYYTFRFGKVRMKDTYNKPSISNQIKDVLLIRFFVPPRAVNEEHHFYQLDKEWFRHHFDLHVGVTMKEKPTILLVGGNIEINKFVDIAGGIALSNDPGYEHHMYYYGITFDSKLFHHIVDMVQQTIQMAEK